MLITVMLIKYHVSVIPKEIIEYLGKFSLIMLIIAEYALLHFLINFNTFDRFYLFMPLFSGKSIKVE